MNKLFILYILFIALFSINAQDVIPVQNGDLFSLTTGDLYFEVDASYGGQVSSFKVGGNELLYFGGGDNVGSTFWPSPQSVWNWPPSKELDSDPYNANIAGNSIRMVGDIDPASNLYFTKTFSANSTEKSISLEYAIKNEGSSAYSVAGWEITRFAAPGGLTFFPMGDGSVSGEFTDYTELNSGVIWYQEDNSDPSGKKFFSDGSEGWVAHVNKDNYLFVKQFEDVSEDDAAPGEAEVEFYHASPSSYIELENQSAYIEIPAGEFMVYTVKWYAEELPIEIDVSIGSTALIEHVRTLVNPTGIDHSSVENKFIFVGPNPASDKLIFQSNQKGQLNVTIFDITGKLIMQHSSLPNEATLDTSGMEAGIYIYSVTNGAVVETGKLIIE